MGGFWLFAVNWHWWIHYIGLYNSLRKPFSKFLSGSWHALVRLGDCLVFTSGESGEIKFHEQFLFNSIDRNTYDKIPGIQIQVSLLLNARHTSRFHWLQRSLQKSHMQQMVVIYCYMAQSVWHFPHGPSNCTGIEYDYHSSAPGVLQIWFHFLTFNLLPFLLINQSRRHFVISPAGKMWAICSGLRKKSGKLKIAHWTTRKC